MKEKMPDLPSLCPCHPSLWASDPNLCARNCQYYQNQSSKLIVCAAATHALDYIKFIYKQNLHVQSNLY